MCAWPSWPPCCCWRSTRAFGVNRLKEEAAAPPGGATLAAQAKLVAAAAETNLAAQRAEVYRPRPILPQRDPNARSTRPRPPCAPPAAKPWPWPWSARPTCLAVAGRDASADWKAAARTAGGSGRSLWIGGGTTGRLYVAIAALGRRRGHGFVIASATQPA